MSKARSLSAFISDPAIDASEIGSNAVTTDKILDSAVTHTKLHTNMDLTSKTVTFADNHISGNKIHGGVISDFASIGIDDNATATAVTINSSGNVGIGGSPSANVNLHVIGSTATNSVVPEVVIQSARPNLRFVDTTGYDFEIQVRPGLGGINFQSAYNTTTNLAASISTVAYMDRTGAFYTYANSDATNISTGAVNVRYGGLGVGKSIYAGGNITSEGSISAKGNIASDGNLSIFGSFTKPVSDSYGPFSALTPGQFSQYGIVFEDDGNGNAQLRSTDGKEKRLILNSGTWDAYYTDVTYQEWSMPNGAGPFILPASGTPVFVDCDYENFAGVVRLSSNGGTFNVLSVTDRNFVIQNNGNVGIGTANPATNLEVNYGGAYTGEKLITLSRNEPTRYNAFLGFGDYAGGNKFGLQLGTTNNYVNFPTITMVDGNVGIGLDNPVTKLQVAGNMLSQKVFVGDYNSNGTSARQVIGWYQISGNSSTTYRHLRTTMWGGGSPYGNSEYIMGGFHIQSYRYVQSAGQSDAWITFHNWSGSVQNGYNYVYYGNWDAGSYAYVDSTGYVTLRVSNGVYHAHHIDLHQFPIYPVRDIRVSAVIDSNSATI